jgi:hypothetical protein
LVKRIGNIVIPRHRQGAALDHLTLGGQRDIELRNPRLVLQIDRPDIGLRVETEGHHAAVGDAANERLNLRMVGAANGKAVERDVGDEIVEPLAQVLDRAPVLHMLGVDIGDDGDGRGQTVEAAVALIRLDHHPFPCPGAGVGAIGMDDSAIDDGGVKATLVQKCRDHRRRRGLAMRPTDGNVRAHAHQFRQHLGPAHHRKAAPARLFQFGVALLDRRGNHHDSNVLAKVLRPLPLEEFRSKRHQPVGDLRRLRVRALDPVAEGHQHLGDARHADAADADEMDWPKLSGQFGGGVHGVFLSVRVRTMSTRRSVASGVP